MSEPGRRYGSLDDALEATNAHLDNRPWIRELCARIGISEYHQTSGYIKAVRSDGGPPLRIAYGWTNGFVSQEEAEAATGVPAWPSEDRRDLWGVTHPVHGHGGSGAGGKPAEVGYGVCPTCHTTITPSGTCLCD